MITNKVRFLYDWGNAFWRTLMTPFTGTNWAEGFSEDRFSMIRLGMSQEQVTSILGRPLDQGCGKTSCSWIYSYQDTGTADFDRRWILFDYDGKVDEIKNDFYID